MLLHLQPNTLRTLVAGVVLTLSASMSWASPQLELTIVAEREVITQVQTDSKSETVVTYEAVPTAALGDIIRYTLTYNNSGDDSAVDIAIVNPIPEGVAYLADSALGDNSTITFSADGGLNYGTPPLIRIVTLADGTEKAEVIPTTQYTHIRWTMTKPVLPKATGTLIYRVQVR